MWAVLTLIIVRLEKMASEGNVGTEAGGRAAVPGPAPASSLPAWSRPKARPENPRK